MKTRSLVFWLYFATILCVACVPLLRAQTTTVFTSSTTIGAANATYDGADIIIEGCTVTVSGIHTFNSLSLSNGAILTQQPATATQEYSLTLTITNNLLVDATSSINVSGCGYLPGYTLGNTTVGAAANAAGGSYGGLGGTFNSAANAVYGDYHNPNELGSGGGTYANSGGSGGGLVRITAGNAQVDGTMLANGGANGDSGSGGGILLNVGTLSGTGQISANGGAATGFNGGGGGRVAIYYSTSTFNLSNNVTAYGAHGNSMSGAAGTVYLQQAGSPDQLVINNNGTVTGQLTPLGQTNDTVFTVGTLILSGSGTVAATVSGAPIQAGSLSLVNGAILSQQPATTNLAYSLVLAVTNNLLLDAASSINVSGDGYLPGYTVGNTTVGAAVNGAGGSYGGLGGVFGVSAANAVYGDYHDPNELGSGSGANDGGGSGGGLVRITAGTAQVDGTILANGYTNTDGGSGGGVLMNVGKLSGAGYISANGGAGNSYSGGGGGRVAIYYGTNTFNLSNNVTANAGHGGQMPGAVGTVYLRQTGGLGQLVINNHGTAVAQWTPLGVATDTVFQVDTLLVSGSGVVVKPEHQMPILADSIAITNGGELTDQQTTTNQEYSLVLTVTNNLLVDATSSINVSGCGYLPGYTLGNTTVGAAANAAGGSYGGLGGTFNSAANAVYGDYHNPNELGSGGGTYANSGGSGGGLVRITAGNAQVDGTMLANGGANGDSGSGGGILLNVGTLSGTGQISANGGAATGFNGGGGGRVAIYYSTSTFNLSNNVTAYGAHGNSMSGAAGTVYLQQAGSPDQLVINNNGTVTGQLTPLGQTNDTVFTVGTLILSGSGTVAATVSGAPIQAGSLSLVNGAILSQQPATTNLAYSLVLAVTNNLLLDAASSINVSGDGYLPGYTVGNTTVGAAVNGAGGSYGGLGGVFGVSAANAVYGDYHDPNELGSGSGANDGGGSGGGLVRITAGTAQVDGTILANGYTNTDGGSGGGVLMNVGKLSGAGYISANGGAGNSYSGGGGGRVAVYTWTALLLPAGNILANGGYGAQSNGQNGSVYIATQPYFKFLDVLQEWHGIEQIAWSSTGLNPNAGDTSDVVISKGGLTYFKETAPTSASIPWNTATVSNGIYTLTMTVLSAFNVPLGQISQTELINNSLAWHEGTLSASQTWGTNAVNAVDQTIIIPSGVTLTIAPGAIVKFAPGTSIIVEAGGVLDASGATAAAPIIFTSLADGSVGGDSEEDGGGPAPLAGDWDGVTGLGQFNTTASVQVRNVIQTVSGTLSANQEWFGGNEYFVNGNIIVPNNLTLTVDPGAIVKFDPGLNLTVESGGTLIAKGTVAQPIIFTSINDESVGAGTITVPTTPAAGDWDSIYLNGGKATFDHVSISYGGGPDSENSGLISIIAPGSVVSVSDSILSQGLYRGIQAEYGTANVTNCLVTGCDRGIQSGLNGPTVVNIINCTVDNNNNGVLAHGGVMNVVNTIVSGSLSAGVTYCCGSSLTTFEYCNVWSTSTNGVNYSGISAQTGVNGNISVNPNFISAAQGNYELNYGSPCINSADGSVAPLTDLLGAPAYNDPRTLVKTGITNANGVYPDMGAFEFVENAPSPVDLIATSVTGPLSVTAGQTVTVQWNDVNIGTANAIGPWHDSISLIPQGGGDAVAATVLVAQHVVLGPEQSYAASASVAVPGGVDGNYQWQVHVNSHGDVFEGVNWTNNITTAAALTVLADPTLVIGGTPVTNTFTAAGLSGVFALTLSDGTIVLNVQGSTPGCVLELFVGDGYVPSPSHFDFESSQFDSPTASVTVPNNNTASGAYYVVVYAVSLDASQVSYALSASQLAFALNSVNPTSIINSGPVTLQILGDQLETTDNYTLTGPGGAFAASSVQSSDPTVAYAIFNLGGAAAGLYSLKVAQPAGPALTLTNAITAISDTNIAATAPPSIQLELPPAYRKSRAFNGTIVYRNAGEIDTPAPILILSSSGVAGMALQGKTNFLSNDVNLIGASFEGPAGTLTPEKSWSIAFSALCGSGATIPFVANYITATATNLIDYNTLEALLRPPGYCANTWSAIWTNFETEAGPTWGGFVSLVDSYSTEMALTNAPGTFFVVQDVLAFAFADLANGGCTNGLSLYPPLLVSLTNIDFGPSQSVPVALSYDPNDKIAAGIGLSGWVAVDDDIVYAIDFANETNASAPAQTVSIADALDTNLDWSTLQLTSIAFNNVIIGIPPGVQSFSTNVNVGTDPNPVAVSASLNPATGVLSWLMESIDPVTGRLVTDPLAGFLPPDNVLEQGEGYVTYTVAPLKGLATGAPITNQASIVFDVNAAILTPVTTNLVDATPPTSSITRLPSTSALTFLVAWSGQDTGSGIADFDIYVSTDGGPWMPWLLDTTKTSAIYSGANSVNYAFYSIAYDEVGNIESNPIIPGASTVTSGMVVAPVPIGIARSGSGNLTLTWAQGTLLQATNLAGPWTTNTVGSPYSVAPTNFQLYFKVLEN